MSKSKSKPKCKIKANNPFLSCRKQLKRLGGVISIAYDPQFNCLPVLVIHKGEKTYRLKEDMNLEFECGSMRAAFNLLKSWNYPVNATIDRLVNQGAFDEVLH